MSKFKIKRHRITFQEPTETIAATGQPVVSWADFRTNEPADFQPTGGMESMRGRQLEAGTKGFFTVNYRTGYTTKMQIVHDGVSYGISNIQQVDGLRREIEIMVKSS